MGVTINFGTPGGLDGATAPGSRIALDDFYDVIADYQKKSTDENLEEILTKKGDALSDEGKDFIRQFIQYSKRNKIFDGFKRDDVTTTDTDEFREALKTFVEGQKVAKGGGSRISFNDTFSANATRLDTDRAEKVVNFDKVSGYSAPLEFFDEDGNLNTQEKVIKDGFLFDETVFREETEALYNKFTQLDDSTADYIKDIEPIVVKLQQGLKLSDEDLSLFSSKLGIDKEGTENLAELIKFKYYQARKEAYDKSGQSPKQKDNPLVRYLLMEPSGSLQDFKYRYLGNDKANYSSAFTETKRGLATNTAFNNLIQKELEGHLATVDSQNYQDQIKKLASQYDPKDGMHYAARTELSRLADEIASSSNPAYFKSKIDKAFNENILLETMPEADRARAILALDGLLSAKPAAARVLKEEEVNKDIHTDEHKMNIRDLRHLSSVKDWLVWLKSSQSMDTLPAEIKSNSRELLEKITNFEDLDYGDLVKFSKLFHTLGINDPQERMSLAHETVKDIYAERQAMFKGDKKLDIAGLNTQVATQYQKNYQLAQIFNNLNNAQRSSITNALEGENLLEISQLIDQSSDFEALQSPHVQRLITKLQGQKDIFSDLLKGTKAQQQKEWLNIIQSLAKFKGNETFDLESKDIASITSMQALKNKSKAFSSDNDLAPGKLTGDAEIELVKKRLQALVASIKSTSKSDKLQELKDLLAKEGASAEAYALIPLLLDGQGKSPIDSYLKAEHDSLSNLSRAIRDDAYFGRGEAADIKELLQVENGENIKIPSYDLDGREIAPPDPVTGQGGGQNLSNNFARGIYAAFDENGLFSEELFDEILKESPAFLDVFQTIDPSTTKEDLVSAFRGKRLDPNAPFMAPYLFQYAIENLLFQLEDKYDQAITGKYSTEDISTLMERRRAINGFFHSGDLKVDVYKEDTRNMTISSQELENALRELSHISSKIKP
jgi:hypothetical protein